MGMLTGTFGGGSRETVAPTLQTATIGTNGVTWTFVFSEVVSIGAGGSAGWVVTMTTAGAITLTYASGTGSTTLIYTGSPTVYSGDTVSVGLNYTQPGNGIEDAVGNDLANISGKAVVNNSTAVSYSDVIFYWGMENDSGTAFVAEKAAGTAEDQGDSAAAVETTTKKVGLQSCKFTNANARVVFSYASNLNKLEGGIGFWFTFHETTIYKLLFSTNIDDNNRIQLYTWNVSEDAYDEIRMIYKAGGSGPDFKSTNWNLSIDTWYFIWAKWDAANNTYGISAYDTDGVQVGSTITDTTAEGTWSGDPSTFTLGNNIGNADTLYFDNVIITNDYDRDLHAIRDGTSFPD